MAQTELASYVVGPLELLYKILYNEEITDAETSNAIADLEYLTDKLNHPYREIECFTAKVIE